MELKATSEVAATPEPEASRLSVSSLISAILVGLVGAMVIFITPGFLALVAQQTGFDNDQLGYLVAWDINAMAVAIGLSTFVLSRVRWRAAVAIGLALIAIGNLLTAFTVSFPAMAAARVVAGCGEGIAIGFAFAALGRASNPDRAFSIYLVAGALLSSAFLYALPVIQAVSDPSTVFVMFAVLSVLVMFSLRGFPEGRADESDIFAGGGKLDRVFSTGALLGVFLLFFAMGAVWSYSERIGISSNLPAESIANGLAIGTLAGVIGAALAGMLPRKWGRSWPLILSGVCGVAGFLLFLTPVSPSDFIIASVLMLFSWNFAQPLLSGICSEACSRGRIVCSMGSIQTFGTGLGPAAVAATLGAGSFDLAIYASCAVLVASIGITIATVARGQR